MAKRAAAGRGLTRGVRAAAVLAAGVALAACGVERDPARDRELAERAVLTVDELPPGFHEGEADESRPGAADLCLERSGIDATPEAVDAARTAQVRRQFEADQGLSVVAEVSVFDDDDLPATLMRLLADDEALECLTDAIQEEAVDDEELSFLAVDLTEAPAVPADLGDQQASVGLVLRLEHVSGQRFDVTLDLYAVRVDRAVATLAVTHLVGQPFAEGDAHRALEAMTSRLGG